MSIRPEKPFKSLYPESFSDLIVSSYPLPAEFWSDRLHAQDGVSILIENI